MPAKVLIYRPVDESGDSHARLAEAGAEVCIERLDASGPPESLRDADILLGATFSPGRMDAAFLERFTKLRLISKYTIGYDDVDLDAASSRGILVTHCPTEANYGGVAEGTVALMLAFLKKVRERDVQVRNGLWRDDSLRGTYLGARDDGYAGISIGIVGFGRIGGRLAELLRPWRVRLLAHDPYVDDSRIAAAGVLPCSFEQLLAQSDVVTLHCSLTGETRNMINAESLTAIKPGALLVNTARGAIVDLDALADAIESGRLGGAALDVYSSEPLPEGSRIAGLGDKVLLCPHMVAANEGGTLTAAIPWATAAVIDALAGRPPQRIVNAEALPLWRRRFAGQSLIG